MSVKPELDTATTAAYPAELRWSALWTCYAQSPLPADTEFLLSEFGSAQARSTLGSRGQRSTVCARSFHIETWPRLPCRKGTKSTAATLAGKNLPSFSFRGAFGCGGRGRVRRGAPGKHPEPATPRRVIPQGSIAADGAQAGGGIRQPRGKTDAGPAADAGQDRNVLLATMLIGGHVADDAGRCLELVEFLAGLGVDGLEVAFERAIED